MKFFTMAILLSVSAASIAQTATTGEKPIEEVKQHRLANIDKRIASLNELKSCVSAAADHNAMKACNQKHKTDMQALKGENQGWREGMKQKRQARKAGNQ